MTPPLPVQAAVEAGADILGALPEVTVASIDTAEALRDIATASTPIVCRDAIEHWPALTVARASPEALNAYLKSRDVGLPGPVMEAPASSRGRFGYNPADPGEFTFSKRRRPVSETLDRIERLLDDPRAPCVAIQMLPLATHLPDFVRDNPLPLLPGVEPLLWLGGRVQTQIHNDKDHNLACVLAGRRRFVLFPPEHVGNLYIGPLDNPPPLSLVDPREPDMSRYPKFADALAAATTAELGPGDALVIPRHWWYYVASLEPYNAMVNYWWGNRAQGLDDPHGCFLTALLALKDLPTAERAYWRAMFDTYVFRTHGHAVDHIPAALRGALGTLSPRRRSALRQQIKTAILKST